jgi:hypothetical protein
MNVSTSTTGSAARHSSEANEHYTPACIVEPARATLGGFDLDPASCVEANARVRAEGIFLYEDDGYSQPWWGRVFVNPPGGLSDDRQRPVKGKCRETGSCGLPIGHTHAGVEASQKKWWFKLAREHVIGNVEAAIFVCFSVELLQNTQVDTPRLSDGSELPIPLDFPICYPSRRVAYVKPGGKVGAQPPHASCIVLVDGYGKYAESFVQHFAPLGRVVVP